MTEVAISDLFDPVRYQQFLSEPETNKFLEARFGPPSLREVKRWWRGRQDVMGVWAGVNCEEFAGVVGLPRLRPNHEPRSVVLVIGHRFSGMGVGAKALNTAIIMFPAPIYVGETYGANVGMQRVFSKCGFGLSHIVRDFWTLGDGKTDKQTWIRG